MDTAYIWPVLVASVAAFAIGAFWYSPLLFGNEWVALSKMPEAEVAAAKAKGMKGMWKQFLAQFVAAVVSFAVLCFLITETGTYDAVGGAFLGFFIWLGFFLTRDTESLLWEKKPMKLVLIGSVCHLLNLVVGGAIIGAWL